MSLSQVNALYDKYFGNDVDRSAADWYANAVTSGKMSLSDVEAALKKVASTREEQYGWTKPTPSTGSTSSSNTTSSTSGSTTTAPVYSVSNDQINSYFNQYLGRNATQADLDWYSKEAGKYGAEWLQNHISSGQEAQNYLQSQQSGSGTGTTTGGSTTSTGGSTGTTGGTGGYTGGISNSNTGYTQPGFTMTGDTGQDLTKAYQYYLGRSPDQGGFQNYMDQINSGSMSVEDAIAQIANSAEQNWAGTITDPGLGQAVSGATSERGVTTGQTVLDNLNNPTLPTGAEQTYTDIIVADNEISDPTDPRFQIGDQAGATASTGTAAGGVNVGNVDAATYDPALVGQGAAGTGTAATGEALSPDAIAEAVIGDLPPEAMVQSQMEELVNGIQDGNIPDWARPAVDAVEAQLAARGLSRSSVGQAALTNAIIQTALPMAQQNATAVTQNFMQDKAAQNQMELANATASQQLQFQNLSNEQQMNMLDVQLRQQAMLSDQAAQNAAAQFNATSENQMNQFMANLKATVDMNTAARLDAMTQFNVSQQNAIGQFNANLQYQRDQFNAQNATAIEQSNLQWRRQVNQLNTAGENAVNQANAMNLFNLSNQALTFMWQEMRDNAQWAFEAAQNDEQRKIALAVAAMGNEAASDANNLSYIEAIGAAAFNVWKSL